MLFGVQLFRFLIVGLADLCGISLKESLLETSSSSETAKESSSLLRSVLTEVSDSSVKSSLYWTDVCETLSDAIDGIDMCSEVIELWFRSFGGLVTRGVVFAGGAREPFRLLRCPVMSTERTVWERRPFSPSVWVLASFVLLCSSFFAGTWGLSKISGLLRIVWEMV